MPTATAADEDEFVAFYDDISAGIPSDDYFCYVAECVWNIQEEPDANPVEGFRRPRPRTTPAMKDLLYNAMHDKDGGLKA